MFKGLRALALLATVAGIGGLAAAMPAPRKGSNRNYDRDPARTRANAALAQEIAAHNAAVDQAKAEKRARKLAEKRSNVRKAHL